MGEPRGAWTKPPTPWTSPKVWAGLPGLPEVWAPCPPPAHTGCEEASRRPHGHPPSPEKPVPSPPRHYRPGPQLPSPGKRAGHSDTDVPPSPWRGPVPLVLLDVLPRPWPPALPRCTPTSGSSCPGLRLSLTGVPWVVSSTLGGLLLDPPSVNPLNSGSPASVAESLQWARSIFIFRPSRSAFYKQPLFLNEQRPREAEFLTLSHTASRSCDQADQVSGAPTTPLSPTYYGQPNPPTHRPERADHWQAATSTGVQWLGRLGNGGTPPLGEPALFAGLHPRYSASLPKALALDRWRLCSQMQPPPPPTTAPIAASAHSHPALPPRGLSISQNCGVSRGQAFPPGVRTMPRRDLWDSLTSRCPGSLRGDSWDSQEGLGCKQPRPWGTMPCSVA